MAEYITVRSNWSSINSISLDRVCDICIEKIQQSRTMENQEETNDDINNRKTTSSDENITSVILRSNETGEREDPIIVLSVLQPDNYHIVSIQILSNAKHIEFYNREYIGSCQGSRITELESESVYESTFEFDQTYQTITLKCLKLADVTQLIVYCLQINLNETKANEKAIPMMNLPFDLNRVRSMIDETNLSSNARQLMNNLQYMQQQRRTEESVSKGLNITQLMCMIKGMTNQSSNLNTNQQAPAIPTSISKETKTLNDEKQNTSSQDSNNIKQEFNALENRLQTYIDNKFLQLQQHIDDRLNHLEQKLSSLIG